jgi:hypothetical protein
MQTMINGNSEISKICSQYGITTEQFMGVVKHFAEMDSAAKNPPKEMTREEAEDILFAEIEKGKKSGGRIPAEKVWAKLGL